MRAQALDAGAGDREVDDVDAGPEADGLTGPGGSEPELAPATIRFPDGGTTRSNSTGPPSATVGGGAGVDRSRDGRVGRGSRDRRQGAGQPERQQLALLVGRGLEALGRRHRRRGVERLVRPLGVVFAHPVIERGLRLAAAT